MNADSILETLRSVQLRPTTVRIAVLQVLADSGRQAISIEDTYRVLVLRGVLASIGTVYRTVQEFDSRGLLVREWRDSRKAMYCLKPKDLDSELKRIRLVCRKSGSVVLVGDADLHAQLLKAARNAGFDLTGRVLSVEVDCLSPLDVIDEDPRQAAPLPHLVTRRG